jgi:hypothetical protein
LDDVLLKLAGLAIALAIAVVAYRFAVRRAALASALGDRADRRGAPPPE